MIIYDAYDFHTIGMTYGYPQRLSFSVFFFSFFIIFSFIFDSNFFLFCQTQVQHLRAGGFMIQDLH
jgi:hypothetical protein